MAGFLPVPRRILLLHFAVVLTRPGAEMHVAVKQVGSAFNQLHAVSLLEASQTGPGCLRLVAWVTRRALQLIQLFASLPQTESNRGREACSLGRVVDFDRLNLFMSEPAPK